MNDVVLDLWGPLACFTPAQAKVERVSYAVPTPSAIRGMLASIYGKPEEFYWLVRRIEVLNPIRYVSCRRNEVAVKASGLRPIDVEDAKNVRTQRSTTMLKDVRYRVTASLIPRSSDPAVAKTLLSQANRRIAKGQCFLQPYLGTRECECYFGPADVSRDPIRETQDFNYMTYDTHVPADATRGKSEANVSLYHCVMVDGVIDVPDYDDPSVLKIGGGVVV